MTSSRPEKSFKEKVIARSRPQNIFQDGKISSSYLKNTSRLDTSFCDISSSYKCFEDNHDGVVWKHVSRRGDIIEKSDSVLYNDFGSHKFSTKFRYETRGDMEKLMVCVGH